MQQRDRQGRFRKERVTTRWEYVICLSILGGIFTGMYLDKKDLNPWAGPIIYTAEASTESLQTPKEVSVLIRVEYSEEGIERLIRETFVGEEDLAVAVVKSEGGLVKEIQSHFVKNGVREPSFCAFQLHEPTWMKKAKELGYGDYKTNVESCVKMAKYIRDNYGWRQWSGYNNGSYLKYLN
jgi:hypothetical protein